MFIQPSRVLSDEGKLSGGNSERSIGYLKRTFCVFLCLRAKENRIPRVLIFANGNIFKISSLSISAQKEAKPVRKFKRGFAVLLENRLPILQVYFFAGK